MSQPVTTQAFSAKFCFHNYFFRPIRKRLALTTPLDQRHSAREPRIPQEIINPHSHEAVPSPGASARAEIALEKNIPLRYWRASLAEVSLLNPEIPPENKPIAIEQRGEHWFVSEATPTVKTWVEEQFKSSKASSVHGSNNTAPKTIPFVLVAARLSERASHGVKLDAVDATKGHSILCIPCLLDRSGKLSADPERHAWIPRDYLQPTLKSIAIGELSSYDDFVSRLPGKSLSLTDALENAFDLFKAVTGSRLPLACLDETEDDNASIPLFSYEDHELVCQWHGLPYEPPIVARNLVKLYDQIDKDHPTVPLLDRLRCTVDQPTRPPKAIASAEDAYKSSWGHINTKQALSPSQREAMVELTSLKSGEILAVNGPPGTGKTTLLQSVVAQLWVNAALAQNECPLVVVTSTNIKAVENVLDSFAKICEKTGHQRWHPYPGGFGLFLASDRRESKHPTCTSNASAHAFMEFETQEAVNQAENYFLERARAHFQIPKASLNDLVKRLHADLLAHREHLIALVSARYEVSKATNQEVDEGATAGCVRLLAQYQAAMNAEQVLIAAANQTVLGCKEHQTQVEDNYTSTCDDLHRAESAWASHLASTPLWLDLLGFLTSVRRRRDALDRCQLLRCPLTAHLRHREDGVEAHLEHLQKQAFHHKTTALENIQAKVTLAEEQKRTAIQRQNVIKKHHTALSVVFERWNNALASLEKFSPGSTESLQDVSLALLNDQLDKVLRAPMFSLADRYWSGQWLIEMKDRLSRNEKDSRGRLRRELMYRRFAKLSPCLVSNFHMAPAFFTAWQGESIPMWNMIDLLIVDEAGQVAPDVGAATFALAQRALVVGDSYQIEPVWNNSEATDRMNAVKFGLISSARDVRYDQLHTMGYASASGSLMHMANRACFVQKYKDSRGLMLTEHRRCTPELIDYCNTLVYAGRLQSKRPAIDPEKRILPAFGRLHVEARDRQVGASRKNEDEALAILHWLKLHRAKIEQHYIDEDTGLARSIAQTVGIITPFAAQSRAIERLLKQEMPDLMRKDNRLTVGTVHALQGAEREVVIFSPTYGSNFSGGAYFDKSPNMLNVAVSRAKDSFLVIGNLALFDAAKRSRPSGLLGQYLFHAQWSNSI